MKILENLNLPDHKEVMNTINEQGFAIIKNCVSSDFIESQRNRWKKRFDKKNVNRKFVRGNLILGEPNFMSYSDIKAWCMYRSFEFLWNSTNDKVALDLHLQIHKFRNKMQGLPTNYGLNYNEENYGIYISTSFYPSGKGRLLAHEDGHKDTPILHYMLPYTFKGKDYLQGGLFCKDKNGKTNDIDANVEPGDLIFFDGRQEHSVDLIDGDETELPGRLAVFSIPTHFLPSTRFGVIKRSLNIHAREWANRFGLMKLG
jgi:hypothetical protein